MRSRRLARPAMAIVVLAASQVGHLVASELRRGPGTLAPDTAGAHAYVPALATLVLGTGGATVLGALLAVAAAAALGDGRGRGRNPPRRFRLIDLTAALFAVQLAVYLVQEVVESLAGRPGFLPTAGDLLLWGCLGQLPAAVVAAVIVRWLVARVDDAVVELAQAAGRPLVPSPVLRPALARPPAGSAPRCRRAVRAAGQRAPPVLLGPF